MRFIDKVSNSLFITIYSSLQKLVGSIDSFHNFFPAAVFDRVYKLLSDFAVWNPHALCVKIKSQITKVDKQRENIVRTAQSSHIILKFCRVYRYFLACHKPCHFVFKPVKIHINVDFQRLIGFCGSPIAVKIVTCH